MTPEEFIDEVWFQWTDRRGYCLPLPDLWQIRVTYIPANREDWDFAVRKAVEASRRHWNPIEGEAIFNYAVGIVWRRLGEISPIDSSPLPSAPLTEDAVAAAMEAADREEEWERTVPKPLPPTLHEREERERREAKQVAVLAKSLKDRDDLLRIPLSPWAETALDEGKTPTMPKIHRMGVNCAPSKRAEPYVWPESGLDESGQTPVPCGKCFPRGEK